MTPTKPARAGSTSAGRSLVESHPYAQRALHPTTAPLAAWLLRLMSYKHSNLCLSADVQTSSQLLDLAEECGDSIVVLKTHCDIITDFGPRTVKGLVEIARRKKFLIFEDRKFGDIGNTVQMQYAAGNHRIARWASLTNAHIFPGPAIITALRSAANNAIAAMNSTVSTEITGGAESYFSAERDLGEDDDEVEDDHDDGDLTAGEEDREEYEQPNYDSDPRRNSASIIRSQRRESTTLLDRRKSSVVSISTTISSSTEYISPPPTSNSVSPAGFPSATWDPERPPTSSRGLLLLAQMSSADNFFTDEYTSKCVELARQHRDFVVGFIAQQGLNKEADDNFLVMTPGVSMPPSSNSAPHPASPVTSKPKALLLRAKHEFIPFSSSEKQPDVSSDGLGQQYNTPRYVILERGADVIIVGRGIVNAADSAWEAERYRKAGWEAYCERTGDVSDRPPLSAREGKFHKR